jgi:hypothetical protein
MNAAANPKADVPFTLEKAPNEPGWCVRGVGALAESAMANPGFSVLAYWASGF